MPNENSEVDSFLKDLKGEDDTNPFKEIEKKVEEPKEEEKIPFHKDEKMQKFIEKEVAKRIGDIPAREVIREVPVEGKETSELKDILTRIIGNDTPEKLAAVKDFEKALSGLEEKGAQRALKQLEDAQQAERNAEIEAQNELADGFDSIENEFDVDLSSSKPAAKALRSDFVDFIKRVSPKDDEGNVIEFPDLPEAFKVFKETRKPESNNRAKELSSKSMTRSGDTSVIVPPKDNSWNAVDKIFGKFIS